MAWSELVQHAEVRRAVGTAVGNVNSALEPYQHIKRWTIAERDFSLELEELTESQKLRRRAVVEHHAAEIAALYTE